MTYGDVQSFTVAQESHAAATAVRDSTNRSDDSPNENDFKSHSAKKQKETLEEVWTDLLRDWKVSRVQGSVWKPTTTKETHCEKGCGRWDCSQMRLCSQDPDPLSSRCGTHSTRYAHLQSQASRLRSSPQVLPTTILFN